MCAVESSYKNMRRVPAAVVCTHAYLHQLTPSREDRSTNKQTNKFVILTRTTQMAHFVIHTIILPGERAHAPLQSTHITHILASRRVNYDSAIPHKRKIYNDDID